MDLLHKRTPPPHQPTVERFASASATVRVAAHDAQVIFRCSTAWRDARDAFTRTAKASSLVELDLGRDE